MEREQLQEAYHGYEARAFHGAAHAVSGGDVTHSRDARSSVHLVGRASLY